MIPLICFTAMIFLLASCAGKLTDKEVETLLVKAYTGGNDANDNGGSFTIIDGITIDSIYQQNGKATVFYHVSGKVENGSKYPKALSADVQETPFTKGIFGWKLK